MSSKESAGRKDSPVRYAVVGLGHIAQVAVLPAFRHAENSQLAALVSDDAEKLEAVGKKYRVKARYGYQDFERCLDEAAVDAVYIALPNSQHREYTVRAARAGRHVLCEKPMALTEAECLEMVDATEAARVKLMVAYRLHFDEANLEAVELARSGRLGEPRLFSSSFTMQVRDLDNIRLKRDLGGGPLYDIGIYCINAARYLFRAEPLEVFGMAATADVERFNEVEEMVSAVLRFPGERIAAFTCSFGASDVASYRLVGTKGDLELTSAYEYAEPMTMRVTVDGKAQQKKFPKSDQFAPELVAFSRCIREDTTPEPSGEEGLADVRIIQALHESVRGGRSVGLRPFHGGARPTPDQAIERPAVREPDVVGVTAPGEE